VPNAVVYVVAAATLVVQHQEVEEERTLAELHSNNKIGHNNSHISTSSL